MKNMKKIASLLLVLVMVFALAAPALAAGDGTITITNGVAGQTYNVYKVFDLTYGGGDTNGNSDAPHSYTVADGWKAFFTGDGEGLNYVDINQYGGVTWKKDAEGKDKDPAEFAEKALAFATAHNIPVAATETLPGDPAKDADTEIKFSGLDLGYYLIDSSLGSLCILDSTNKNAIVTEKNEKPKIEKTIPEPAGLRVGSEVEYEIVVKAMRGATKYVVTDTMTNLTFNEDSLKVQHKNETGATVDYPTDQYTLTPAVAGFTLSFEDAYLKTLTDGLAIGESHDITITYTGTITAAALEKDEINNTASLKYGDKGTQDSTPEIPVHNDLYSFDLVKTSSDKKLLAGAVFKLKDSNGEPISLVFENDYYRPLVAGETPETVYTEITTNDTGVLKFRGFGNGTYLLEEITAPDGYNKLKEDVDVVIEGKDKTAVMNGTTWDEGGVQITNLNGTELPETGGIGTTLFYIVGGLLIVGAAVLLITKKRVSGEQ